MNNKIAAREEKANAKALELTMGRLVGSGKKFESAKAKARESCSAVLDGGGDEAQSQALDDLSAAFMAAGDDRKTAESKAHDALSSMLDSRDQELGKIREDEERVDKTGR